MISQTIWTLLTIQILMGGLDTLFHHELTERLAWRPEQARELRLHGVRNLIYAIVFATLGLSEPGGCFAMILIALLVLEIIITLVDFVEEDRSRRLPATERVLHSLLTLNYGIVLALLVPVLVGWAERPSEIVLVANGWLGAFLVVAGLGVAGFGIRDLLAAARCARLIETDPASLNDGLDKRQSILVTGGTGFVGKRLIAALVSGGHDVTLLTRNPGQALTLPMPLRIITTLDQIGNEDRIDAIINLAGEPIANGLWTQTKRALILQSRIDVTAQIARLCARLTRPPTVLINGSATGYYGVRKDGVCDEGEVAGSDFCATVCAAWEAEAERIAALGIRTVRLRIGLVLGRGGGMLANLLVPFELGLGGKIGSGNQVMSWIHRDDLVRLIVFCIARTDMVGAVNAVAPNPATNAAFTKTLATSLHRLAFIPVPTAPLLWAAGDLARELLLGGQIVLPVKAVFHGFGFRYPNLELALSECTGAPATKPAANHSGLRRARLLT